MQKDKICKQLSKYNTIYLENNNIYRALTKSLGLSEGGFWILYALRTDFIPPFQSEICSSMHHPKQTVNSSLKKLEADGYITLLHDKDHRSKQICLKQKVICLCEKKVDRFISLEQDAFASLAEEEQEQFLLLFDKYTNILKEYTKRIIHNGKG